MRAYTYLDQFDKSNWLSVQNFNTCLGHLDLEFGACLLFVIWNLVLAYYLGFRFGA